MSHNSDGSSPDLPFKLKGSQAKTAYAIEKNVERMIAEDGIECIVFTTFTIGQRGVFGRWVKVHDGAEASRRWNNLARRVLKDVFERAVVVTERHADGGIHFHVIGVLAGRPDVRTGLDFAAIASGDYSSAPPALHAVWDLLREQCPKYGFGRAETLPIKSSAEAVSRYVSKYVQKNLFNRLHSDAHKKLVRYLGWNKRHLRPNDFSWCSPKACEWRRKAMKLGAMEGAHVPSDAREILGPRWAWRLTKVMAAVANPADPIFMDEWDTPWQAISAQFRLAQHVRSNLRKQTAEAFERQLSEEEMERLNMELEWLRARQESAP